MTTDASQGFSGPYAAGPPSPALRVVAPSLTWFSWREVVRAAEIGLVFWSHIVWAVVAHVVRHWRHPREGLAKAASVGVVEAFMALGPTFVKFGQMIASSPGLSSAPLVQRPIGRRS